MSYYVPSMQQRYTGYDSGRNTANSLLDAVRIKNQREATERSLNIAETEAANRQKLFEQDQATRQLINKAFVGRAKDRQQAEDLKKRMEKSGTGASLPYQMAQWLQDFRGSLGIGESKEQRKLRESGGINMPSYAITPEDLEGTDADISRLYPFLFGPENLLQSAMMTQPAYTQQLNLNPATGTYE